MSKTLREHNFMVVDLTENVLVRTLIPSPNHAALRSGFAGYPVNPRWTATKFQAWKTGRHWREALARNEMVVRSTDSMLVLTQDAETIVGNLPLSQGFNRPVNNQQVFAS